MSVGAIIIIAIAATGVLTMQFSKRWLVKFNAFVTESNQGVIRGRATRIGNPHHVDRKSS